MLPFREVKNTDVFVYDFKDFSFPAHFHDSLEIIVVRKGEIGLRTKDELKILKEGEIGVVFPSVVHGYERIDGKENCGDVLLLGSRLFGEYRDELVYFSAERNVYSVEELHPDCMHAVNTLLNQPESLRINKAYTRLFLCRFAEIAAFTERKSKSEDLLYSLVDYMGKHFKEDVTLQKAADALFVSKYTVSGVFSRCMNMNFNDYLNSLRINFAMQLMEDSGNTITDICYEAGFGNVRTFNRAFLKLCNMTPSEYRKKLKKT